MKGSPVRVRASASLLTRLARTLEEGSVAAAPVGTLSERRSQRPLVERDRRLAETGAGACAAPAPGERVCGQAGLDRVVGEVAADADQIGVAFDLARERVRTEEVRTAPAAPVVPARVPAMELLESTRDACVGSEEDEVVVRAHQDVGDEAELEALEQELEPLEEGRALAVAQEEVARVAR